MEEMKEGTLRSGRSAKRVTNPRQAIAIGLSEARREGAEIPPPARGRSRASKGPSRGRARPKRARAS